MFCFASTKTMGRHHLTGRISWLMVSLWSFAGKCAACGWASVQLDLVANGVSWCAKYGTMLVQHDFAKNELLKGNLGCVYGLMSGRKNRSGVSSRQRRS